MGIVGGLLTSNVKAMVEGAIMSFGMPALVLKDLADAAMHGVLAGLQTAGRD